MSRDLEGRLRRLQDVGDPHLLAGGLNGLEKESLRVTPDGAIAQTPHAEALGSALTHPSITTDYSEALLEFITPPLPDATDTLADLERIHTYVYQVLEDELLWVTSMPCVVGGDASIPIAEYGTSNAGRMKHVYRRGLEYRYGRVMQAIAGIHYNYSLPIEFWPMYRAVAESDADLQAFRNEHYFGLTRNFQRYGWLVPYLFGASPALCRSFIGDREHHFEEVDGHTLYLPYATSLRMSDIGYKNKAQAALQISYNNIDTYVENLTRAITTPAPEYADAGVHVDGEWRQLNGNILQIENEYYSFVRPKSLARPNERPTLALRRRGVDYIEIRALDVNVFHPMGVDLGQLHFLECFLLVCLLRDSPPISADEQREVEANQSQVAVRGRDPSLRLHRNGDEVLLRDWASALLEDCAAVAEQLDAAVGDDRYRRAVTAQRAAVDDPEATPSARILREMAERQESFIAFGMRWSHLHADRFRARPLPEAEFARMAAEARDSLARQKALEQEDEMSFEAYMDAYFRD